MLYLNLLNLKSFLLQIALDFRYMDNTWVYFTIKLILTSELDEG